MIGYDYDHKIIGPRVVEFFVRSAQGHRVVRVYMHTTNPRILAFNESNGKRSAAILYLREIEELIVLAHTLLGEPE